MQYLSPTQLLNHLLSFLKRWYIRWNSNQSHEIGPILAAFDSAQILIQPDHHIGKHGMCAGTVLLNSRQVFRLALSKLEKCQLSKRATFELTSGGVSTRVSFNHHSTICSMSPPSLALKPSELHKNHRPHPCGAKASGAWHTTTKLVENYQSPNKVCKHLNGGKLARWS